jgi:thioredoxin 1
MSGLNSPLRAFLASLFVVAFAVACGPTGPTGAPASSQPTAEGSGVPAATRKPAPTPIPALKTPPYDESADAKKDIAAAFAKAKADKKYVFLDFGANWCPDCHVLRRMLDDDQIKPFVESNYHVVSIDVGNWDKNLDVSAQYGSPIDKGIPAVVILDPDGTIITSTKEGQLADARSATKQDIFDFVKKWAPKKT